MQLEQQSDLEVLQRKLSSRDEEISRLNFHIGALIGHLEDTARSINGVSVELDGDQRLLLQAMARLIAAKIEDANVRAMTFRKALRTGESQC